MANPYRVPYQESARPSQDTYYTSGNPYNTHIPQQTLLLSQSRYSPQPASPRSFSASPYSDHHTRSTSRHRHRHHGGRSRSRSSASRHRDDDESHDRKKEIGVTLAGAAGGGILGREFGGGTLATLGGAVAGAVAANALERRHEKHKPRSNSFSSDHHERHNHRSSLDPREIKDEIKEKITEFLSAHGDHGDGKRSRSHGSERPRRRSRGGSRHRQEVVEREYRRY